MRFSRDFLWNVAVAIALCLLPDTAHAAEPAAKLLADATPLRAIRYTFPDASWPNTLPPLCAMARDLPLLRASGGAAVLTNGAPPEDGDHIFLSLLASTGLSWISTYSPPADLDATRPLLEQREVLLARFRDFASRFQGNPSLRGVVLDFGAQRAVEVALLAPEFAAILAKHFPENTPALGVAAYTPDSVYNAPAGAGFWLYRFAGAPPSGLDRTLLSQRSSIPVVFDLSGVARQFPGTSAGSWKSFLTTFTAGAASSHLVAIALIGEREAASSITVSSDGGGSSTTSVIRYREDALFRGKRDAESFENLEATPFTTALREWWQAEALADYSGAPALESLLNAATQTEYVSPGTRIAFRGALLGAEWQAPPSPEWPLHAGATCLCVGERPVAMGSLEAGEGSAQLPWLILKGLVPARFVREGTASAAKLIEVLDVSPGIFPRRIQRSDAGCSAEESDGVRPGETIEIEATGAGPLNGDPQGIEVLLNSTPSQVLEAGLSSDSLGLTTLRVKLPSTLAESERKGLYLRAGARASNLIPMDFVGDARPTVSLVAERPRILLQPGALSTPLRIDTRGLNGFCGRIEFSVEGLPKGVSALIAAADAGKPASLQLRADSTAEVTEGRPFYLYALPTPGDLATLALEVRVMPQVGAMTVKLESKGFTAGATAAITWNGELLPPTGPKAARGLYLQVIDPRTGIFFPVERYDVWESKEESNRMEVRINTLRSGVIVGMAVADEGTLHMQPSLKSWIQTKLGSAAIATLGYQHSWAILSKVGATAPLAESASATSAAVAEAVLALPEKN
ncbi:MAG: interleukin-like EMT inducer domain-containing protein [Bryobacterales bacterium]|nr:interleukin-like EMT inducer domain-containing protein [Bryobacterales bacterium]